MKTDPSSKNENGGNNNKSRKPGTRLRANRGVIYLTPEDLARLMGTTRMKTAWERHKTIREAIAPGKRSLTILEYCQYESENYVEIYYFLRGEIPKSK